MGLYWTLTKRFCQGLRKLLLSFYIPYDKEQVREFILKFSVQDLLEQVAEERTLDAEVLIKCVPRVLLIRMLK